MTQLVFEHALRIRLHTPSDKADDKEVPLVTVKEPEPEPEAEQSTAQPSSEVEAEANLSANTTTPVSESPGNTQGETSDGTSATVTPISADDQKSKKSLIGVMTNLATTDLNILTSPCDYLLEGREFQDVTAHFYQVVNVLLSSIRTNPGDPCLNLPVSGSRMEVWLSALIVSFAHWASFHDSAHWLGY